MIIESIETHYSKRSREEILGILTQMVASRGGRICGASTNSMRAKFGSKIMLRLFGAIVLDMWNRRFLPYKMEAIVEEEGNGNRVNIHLSDNLGKFIVRDRWGAATYREHFANLLREMKERI